MTQLTPALLLNAYAQGVFPMAERADAPQLHWFDPPRRGVLPVGKVHASRSLRRDLRRGDWSAWLNRDFDAVVRACADREATWINGPLLALYHALHQAGYAHSIEVQQDGVFAGGIFGVTLGSAFFGESMVSGQTNGSKMALLWTSSHLRQCGFTLFDTQFLTPHLKSMGGVEISRGAYKTQLKQALRINADFTAKPLLSADQLWQEMTQTS